MSEPYYAAVSWPDGSWSEALRDSRAEAEAWLREAAAHGDPVTTAVLPQRQRTETQQATQDRLAALRAPEAADWTGPLYAAWLLCAADRQTAPVLIERRLAELDVEAGLVEAALAARIMTTARANSLGPTEALHLELDDVRWHQQDPLSLSVPETMAGEIDELRRRANADPDWWSSLWRHVNAILHGHLLAGLAGDARARSPTITERLRALEEPEHG